MTFRASISTNILRIDPSELVPSPASHEARRRILAAGDAYQARQATARKAMAKKTLLERITAVSQKINSVLPEPKAKRWAPVILAEVAKLYAMEAADIPRKSKLSQHVKARGEAAYRLYAEIPTLSVEGIGKLLALDHSTVITSMRRHAKLHELPLLARDGKGNVYAANACPERANQDHQRKASGADKAKRSKAPERTGPVAPASGGSESVASDDEGDPMTPKEITRAADLWRNGKNTVEIAAALWPDKPDEWRVVRHLREIQDEAKAARRT